MRFIVTFVPDKGPLLAVGERQPIGLAGLDQIRKANRDIEASDVLYKVERKAYPSIAAELSEAGARALGAYFRDACEAVVKVHQAEPDNLPLQRFIHQAIAESKDRLTWLIDPDDVVYSWLLAGAPLLWDSPYAKPDELAFEDDAPTELLRAQTMRKLQEFEPDQPLLELRRRARAINDSLLEWMTAHPSTWNSVVSVETISNINGHLPHAKPPAAKELRQAFPPGLVSLKATNAAIDARIAWLQDQKGSSWKETLLNELSKEDACIMDTVEKVLAGAPNDFDNIPTWPRVRDLIRRNEGWLSNRPNVVELMPPPWQKFYEEL